MNLKGRIRKNQRKIIAELLTKHSIGISSKTTTEKLIMKTSVTKKMKTYSKDCSKTTRFQVICMPM